MIVRDILVPMTQWLDADEMAAWLGMVTVHADLMAELEDDLMDLHGISAGEYGVLVNLSAAPDDRLRMCDLAARLHLSPSGLTRRLDGLVRDGLVAREPAADDRRVIMAVLTPLGRARLEAAAPDHVAGVRRAFLDHMTRAQIRQMGAAFAAVATGREAAAAARPDALADAS
jgi:DNA-binding MarR family transcriptional regulator